MSALLVVSPHLDDAVLSCAGMILAHVRRGTRVVIATVFSDGHDHARRREEDRSAAAFLGAESQHLGLLDAPERLGLSRTHRALVEEAVVDDGDVAAARSAIEAVVQSVRPTWIAVPLGVGGHVDHRVVHAALGAGVVGRAPRASGEPVTRDHRGRALVLYEDRPYSLLSGAVRARLAELELAVALGHDAPEVSGLDAAPDAATVAAQLASLPHLRAHLAAADDGARARAWLSSHVCAEHARHAGSRAVLDATVTVHDAAAAETIGVAIAMYRSQVDALFGGSDGVARSLREAARALGTIGALDTRATAAPHAERTFRVRSP